MLTPGLRKTGASGPGVCHRGRGRGVSRAAQTVAVLGPGEHPAPGDGHLVDGGEAGLVAGRSLPRSNSLQTVFVFFLALNEYEWTDMPM